MTGPELARRHDENNRWMWAEILKAYAYIKAREAMK